MRTNMNYGFIGFGHLAKAIYNGLANQSGISFAYTSKSNSHTEIPSFSNLSELVDFSDVICLCVKPQDLPDILAELKEIPLQNKVILSPVAGKNTSFIESYLGKNVPIVRIMPNLAIAYKKSVTAFFTKDPQSPLITKIKDHFSLLGRVVELPEERFHLFTAIFGSGPAFLLAMLEPLKNKIRGLNISDKEANELLAELVAGTLTYFQENHARNSIEDLIKAITSKGGTTEAGLAFFKDKNLDKLIGDVILAAEKRSEKM